MVSAFLERFFAVAREHSDLVALEHGPVRLSYAQLVDTVQDRARIFQRSGCQRETIVAVSMPRALDTIISLLATWVNGAAYAPIDPAWPAERRTQVLRELRPSLIVESDELRTGPQPRPASCAYVFYTSGSTGRPKGVAVAAGGLMGVLAAQITSFGLQPGARSFFMLSPAFDASLSDIGTAILSGATLVLPKSPIAPSVLLDELRRLEITHVDLPPAYLPRLDHNQCPSSLQTIVIGGEVASFNAVRRWADEVNLVNVYGPTEATICTSLGRATSDWSRPLLGQPIAAMRYHIEPDDRGFDTGELWISGPGLAEGYLDQPDLTATKFISREGVRWYRSGDRVAYRGGEYEFLGRIDRQFKRLGKLIAPEEIERVLLDVPGVERALVFDEKELSASVSPSVDQVAINQALERHLPDWMRPTRIMFSDQLPTNTVGKVDESAVREHHHELEILRRIWCDVLGLSEIAVDDDFFSLGGTSLTSLDVIARADRLGLHLPADAITTERTLERVARRLGKPERSYAATDLAERARTALRPPAADEHLPGTVLSRTLNEADADQESHLKHKASRERSFLPNTALTLITGATGFLGSRVLKELLSSTDDQFLCLVRAPTPAAGRARIVHALDRLGAPRDTTKRIQVQVADLAASGFGLDDRAWSQLADRVGNIIHLAARVDIASGYEQLEASNVHATREILRLARVAEAPLTYASTLSVAAGHDPKPRAFSESDPLPDTGQLWSGYAATKWVAERMVSTLAQRGLRAQVVRLGLLTPDSERSDAAPHCQLTAMLELLATIRGLPEHTFANARTLSFDMTPIDYAAKCFARLTTRAHTATWHVCAPHSTSLAELLEAWTLVGHPIERIDESAFLARMRDVIGLSHGFLSLAYRTLANEPRLRASDLFLATDVSFHSQATQRAHAVPWALNRKAYLIRLCRAALARSQGQR